MIDAPTFRSTLGRFATGVTVLTARDAEGRDHGMTVSAFCSVSLDPARVLCCVERSADMHAIIEEASHFAVNILTTAQESISRRFAEERDDRFDGLGYTRGITGLVLLEDTLGYVECEVAARYDGGDHLIVLGDVIAGSAAEGRPLLYYRGGYAQMER
jgi:flavin reductase (DIM6/NTAB) family NADH-FMN oxidoreductase RutF